MKKVFFISTALFLFTALSWAGYFFVFKKTDITQQTNSTANIQATAGSALTKQQTKIVQISKEAVFGAVMDKKTEKIFFLSSPEGALWQSDADGTNQLKIVATKLTGLVGASWSPDKTKVLLAQKENNKQTFSVFDVTKKESLKLDTNIDSVNWDTLGSKIAYKFYDAKNNKRSLSVANFDGKNWQTLVSEIPFREVVLKAVPLSALISFWNAPQASQESLFQVVSLMGAETKKIFQGRFGADYLWSPTGKQVLISSLSSKESKTMTLGLLDLQGQYNELNVPTLVSKCTWSVDGKTIFYALPGEIPKNAIMPDDYQAKKFTTKDTFWKMDLETGTKERIVELAELKNNYDASDLFLSPTESSLYFINKIDGKLYKINL